MNPDSHDLIQRHMAGLLTDDEAAALQTRLKADTDLRRLYLHYMNLDVALEAQAGSRDRVIDLLRAAPLTENKPAGRWLSWFPLTAAAACAVLVFAWWTSTQGDAWAMVSSVEGNVEIVRDMKLRPARVGDALRTGDRIRAGEGGAAQLAVMGLGTVGLGPEASLQRGTEARMLELSSGFIEIAAEKQPANRPWRIRTPQAEAAVIGTKFTLAAADTRTALRVSEGVVRLTSLASGKAEAVSGGSRAFVTADAPPVVAGSRTGSVLLLTSRIAPSATWDRFNRLIGDKLVGARLWRLGFRVDAKYFDEVQPADLRGCALVIVSIFAEGIGEPALKRIGLAQAGVPVVCLEPAAYPTLDLVKGGRDEGFGFAKGGAVVNLALGAHPLLSSIREPSRNWLESMQGWGRPVPSADTLASLGDQPEHAVWFAYESGRPLASAAASAPARRVGLFLDPQGITDSANPVWQVFEASVDWSVFMGGSR